MKVTPGEIEKNLKLLEKTPRLIVEAVRDINGARLQDKSDMQDWSVNEILAHLRSCADVWGDSIDAMLTETSQPCLNSIHVHG